MTVAVLFDLEETLIQTPWSDWQHVLEFRRKTREKLITLGIPFSVLDGIERATLMRNKAFEYAEKKLTKTETEKFHLEMDRFFSEYELDSAIKSKLLPETISTLKKLRELGIKIGLVTNTSIKAVKTVFQRHDLEEYFDVVVTREKVRKLKPDPEGILLAVKTLGAKHFFMVGDLVFDVIATRKANGVSIFLEGSSQEKGDSSADYVVKSLSEISTIVQREMEKF